MNRKRVEKLADFIEEQGELNEIGFAMSVSMSYTRLAGEERSCGCIAGHATVLSVMENDPKLTVPEAATKSREFLGQANVWLEIEPDMACALFMPDRDHAGWYEDWMMSPRHITREDAVRALRRLAEGCEPWHIWDFKKEEFK